MLSLSLISAKERPHPQAVSRYKPVLEASDDDDAMSIKVWLGTSSLALPLIIHVTDLNLSTNNHS